MKNVRQFEMLGRLPKFMTDFNVVFISGSQAEEAFEAIVGALSSLKGVNLQQVTGSGVAKGGTTIKTALYNAIHDELQAISTTAQSIARKIPGTAQKFLMPANDTGEALLVSARAFAIDFLPLTASFLGLNMKADFITRLQANTESYEAAQGQQQTGGDSRNAATADNIATLANAMQEAKVLLDTAMKNLFVDNPGALGAWVKARHVERGPHHPAAATPPPAPITPPQG
jgi:hypothetical protein